MNKNAGKGGNQAWFWVPARAKEELPEAIKKQTILDPSGSILEYRPSAVFEYDKPGFLLTRAKMALATGEHGDVVKVGMEDMTETAVWRWVKPK